MAKIVIVGGGVAGLSAGIYARLAGHSAVVCERHHIAGGNLTGWNRSGYHIDNCIHWLTGTNPASHLYKMWVDLGVLGEGIEIVQCDSLFTAEKDGKRLSLPPSLKELRRAMLEHSKGDNREIDKFIHAIELIEASDHVAGEKCNEGMTPSRLAKGVGPLMKYYKLTTGQLAGRFNSPVIRSFITGFWGEDFSSLALIYVFATYCGKNGALPRGGSLKSAERMVERFKELGGRLRLRCEAVRVNLLDGVAKSVTFADGSVEEADYVILTTDPASTFGSLVDLPMPKQIDKLYHIPDMRRFSSYHCAYACDETELPFEGDLIFDIPKEYEKDLGTKQLIVREFSHEPSYSPEGKNILQTMTFCYEEDSKAFIEMQKKDKKAYQERKRHISEVLKKLIEEHEPKLRGKLTLIDSWTPATYNKFVNSQIGSFMSFAIPSNYLPSTVSGKIAGCKNMFMATQWQSPPGGLPTAAMCGRDAVRRILKMEKAHARV